MQQQPAEALEGEGLPRRTVDLREYAQIAFKHKWGIIGLTLLVGLVAALLVFRQVHIYRATATLMIEREGARFVNVEDFYGYSSYNWEYYQTQYELLKSRPIAERVVDKLKLDEVPKSTVRKPKSSLLGLDWKSWFPDEWFPRPPPQTAEQRRAGAISSVAGGAKIEPVRNSQLVRLSFEGPDPELIARMANALGDSYIESVLEGRLQMTQKAASWLTERLAGLRAKLEASERLLQDYREREKLLDVQGIDSLEARELQLVSQRLAEARQKAKTSDVLVRQLQRAGKDAVRLGAIPALLEYPLVQEYRSSLTAAEKKVQELSKTYGPKHPKMIAAAGDLETTRANLNRQLVSVASSILSDRQGEMRNVSDLERQLSGAKGDVREINRKEYELETLQREVEANRQLYDLFQTRFKETSAVGEVQSANARIVEAALPPTTPVRPNKRRTVMIGLFFGLMAGIGLAFLLEQFDNTMKGTADVERHLAIPVLGMLPLLETKGKRDTSPMRHFSESSRSTFSEAVRTVRTGVLLSALDNPHKIVLVTSSVPSEGKTTTAMNLAFALGHMKKVLLIDADMRRPMVGKATHGGKNRAGLSQFITGGAKLSECAEKQEGSDLYIMSAGQVPPNPLEILSSRRFAESLDNLCETFEHIVIDCAPALAVSDALVLSKLASAVIYVVRADSTPYQAAQSGMQRLRRVDAPVIGAVVNRVEKKGGRYYGRYGYYYGDRYQDYGYQSGET